MIEIIEVICAITFMTGPNEGIRKNITGIPLDTSTNTWYVDFSINLEQIGFNFKYDTPIKYINSNDCLITKSKELK